MNGRQLQDLIPERTQNYFQTLTFRPCAFVNLAPQDRCFFSYFFMLTGSMWLTPCLLYRYLLMQVDALRGGIQKLSTKCFAYKLHFNVCMHKLHWQQKHLVSKQTPVALRQTWINAHCTETEGRDNLSLLEKVRIHAVTRETVGQTCSISSLHFTPC